MIRDITIGQYYRTESVIHRLDPRVKIVGTLCYMISLFTFQSFAGYIAAIPFFAFVLLLSRVPFSYAVKGLKPVFVMLILTSVLNLFWTEGTVIVRLGFVSITWEGLKRMIVISLRLILLIIGASVLTLTTTPNQLTDGLEHLFSTLKKVHVPVHEIAMMMSIALRFIPILIEETGRIMKAQTARGADFETGSVLRRIKNMFPIFIPLFVSAVHRAGDLADAMDARCYHGGDGRTKLHPLHYTGRDSVAFFVLLLYLLLLYFVKRYIPY